MEQVGFAARNVHRNINISVELLISLKHILISYVLKARYQKKHHMELGNVKDVSKYLILPNSFISISYLLMEKY